MAVLKRNARSLPGAIASSLRAATQNTCCAQSSTSVPGTPSRRKDLQVKS